MVENKYSVFAQNLRVAMERKAISVTDLKRHLGITYEMARRYTLGIAKPRHEKMQSLADFVGLSPAELEYGGTAVSAQKSEIDSLKVARTSMIDDWLQQASPNTRNQLDAIKARLDRLDDADLTLLEQLLARLEQKKRGGQ